MCTKVGEENLKKLEKRKHEEKLAEDELGRKIRTLKMTISRDRRGEHLAQEQPAKKKRKITEKEYKRVMEERPREGKRKEGDEKETASRLKTIECFPIFKPSKKLRTDKKDLPHNQLKEEKKTEKHPQKQAEDWEMELSKLEETIERNENEAQGSKRKIGMMDRAWKLLELGKGTIESEDNRKTCESDSDD